MIVRTPWWDRWQYFDRDQQAWTALGQVYQSGGGGCGWPIYRMAWQAPRRWLRALRGGGWQIRRTREVWTLELRP